MSESTVKIDSQVVATCVAMPLTAAHIASTLRAHAQIVETLATNLETLTARICVGIFPDTADPLAAIHPERDVDAWVEPTIANAIAQLGEGLRLAQMYAEAEVVEYLIGEEELMQAVAVLRGVGAMPMTTAAALVLHKGGDDSAA